MAPRGGSCHLAGSPRPHLLDRLTDSPGWRIVAESILPRQQLGVLQFKANPQKQQEGGVHHSPGQRDRKTVLLNGDFRDGCNSRVRRRSQNVPTKPVTRARHRRRLGIGFEPGGPAAFNLENYFASSAPVRPSTLSASSFRFSLRST